MSKRYNKRGDKQASKKQDYIIVMRRRIDQIARVPVTTHLGPWEAIEEAYRTEPSKIIWQMDDDQDYDEAYWEQVLDGNGVLIADTETDLLGDTPEPMAPEDAASVLNLDAELSAVGEG